jgi:DNA-binding transcriptional LysR family regulator
MSAADALEPRLLRSFVAVAEALHFGRAAKRLHISQPPLSVQIRTLEERLGARLFERDRRGVALTEAGAFLLQRARYHLDEAERSCLETARIARGEAGVLSVGYTPTATCEVLPRALVAFRARWPHVRLELRELRSAAQCEALRAGRIEVGFACGPVKEAGIAEHVLSLERFILTLPPGHPLASRPRLKLRHLDGAAFVSVRPDIEPAWAEACTRAFERAQIAVNVVQETDSKIAMLGLVAAGLGVAVLSQSMRRFARDGVIYRDVTDLTLRVPLVALLRPDPSIRALQLVSAARTVPPPRQR